MRQRVFMMALIGVLGATSVGVALEGEGHLGEHREGNRGEMPSAMKAIKEKYQAQKEQLHNEFKQKMQALEQAQRAEMQAAMDAEHKKRMEEMEKRYQEHKQEMGKRMEEHRQERPNEGGASPHA